MHSWPARPTKMNLKHLKTSTHTVIVSWWFASWWRFRFEEYWEKRGEIMESHDSPHIFVWIFEYILTYRLYISIFIYIYIYLFISYVYLFTFVCNIFYTNILTYRLYIFIYLYIQQTWYIHTSTTFIIRTACQKYIYFILRVVTSLPSSGPGSHGSGRIGIHTLHGIGIHFGVLEGRSPVEKSH